MKCAAVALAAGVVLVPSCSASDSAVDGNGAGSGGTPGSGGVGGSSAGTASGGASPSGGSAGTGTGGSGGAGSGGVGGVGGVGGTGATGGSASGTSTEPNLKVAFLGDQGAGTNARAVYQVVLDEGAALTVALGDFDYQDNPDLWDSDINAVLGADHPLFGVVGNHDTAAWAGYKQKLTERLSRIPDASCEGSVGEQQNCKYRGLRVVLSGIGTLGSDTDHEAFLQNALAADPTTLWKFCGWHQNQNDMQLGDKSDAIGWQAFQTCQQHGAIIGMGHEHTYGRTLTLTDLGNVAAGHGATGAPDQMEVASGRTFVFYNGLGGSSIRAYSASLHDDDTWWATMYASNRYVKNGVTQSGAARYGALFIVFNVDGDPSKATGYFKTIAGDVIDEFTIVRN